MKQMTTYNRAAGYLNKLFDLLNADFFDGQLERPVITIQSTPRAYGHYTLFDAWDVKGKGSKEINIGAGTLARPIENVIATLLHEMCHQYNDTVLHVQDCSRGGTYHNRFFRETALSHGLQVSRSEKYGWSTTVPSNRLLDWVLANGLTDIQLNRNEFCTVVPDGKISGRGVPVPPSRGSSYRRYVCPSCGLIVRATKTANVLCGDCMQHMAEAG